MAWFGDKGKSVFLINFCSLGLSFVQIMFIPLLLNWISVYDHINA